MKNLLLVLFLLISSISLSQVNSGKPNDQTFNSVFKDITSGTFNGTINGVLIIKNDQNKKSILDFQGSDAILKIEEDIDKVYDVSFKRYNGKTTSGKTEINYDTYAYANALEIKVKDEYYRLTFIDGACDAIINGLEYSYESEKSAEYLILRVTKEIELKNDYNSEIRKSIKLLPNSTLTFAIKRE